MRIYRFILIWFILLLNIQVYSQSAWKWINPVNSNKTFYNTLFLNENTGYTALDFRIYRTTNAGLNWIIPGDTNVNSVIYSFQNVNTGYKVCIGGIYKTTNAGVNWNIFKQEMVGYSISSFSVFPNNPLIFSATYYSPFGPTASLWFTSNNGINWTNPAQPSSEYIDNIKILRNDLGLALSIDTQKVYLLKSSSPATSWYKIFTGINNAYSGNLFIQDTLNYYISASGLLWKSTNGGMNWKQTDLSNITSIQFADYNNGIAVGGEGKIYQTTNGGLNWNTIRFPFTYNYKSVSLVNSSTGYITGDYGAFLKTTNSGANWISDSKYFTKLALRDIKMLGRDTILICGDSGYVYSSFDQGNNWNTQKPGLDNPLYRMFFLNNTNGFAVGRNGTIIKTTNTGVNWNLLSTSITEFWLLDVFFTNQNTGFIATGTGGFTSNGYLYKTTNGGNDFALVNTPINTRFFAIRFINQNKGFLSSFGNKILITTDAGNNWVIANTPALSQGIYDIQFLDENTGFAAGLNGYLLKTTDGGSNWFTQTQLNTTGLYNIKFVNNTTGFVTTGGGGVGGKGEIFITTNGGTNWTNSLLHLDTWNNIIYSIDFYNDTIGFVSGDNGMLMKTTTGGIVGIKKLPIRVLPEKYSLSQNYPNPFNPMTNVKFSIVNAGDVKVVVYDVQGREVQTLVNERLQPGTYEAAFDGSKLNSGVYFYKLVTGNFTETKKMLLIK